jgi:methyl-accepting chemotaxis protein
MRSSTRGIDALGQRVLGHIKVGPRLTLAVFALLIPVLVLATLYQLEKREQARITRYEQHGVDYLIVLHKALDDAASLYGALLEHRRGDNEEAANRASKHEGDIDAAIAKLESHPAREVLHTNDKLALLKQHWKRLKSEQGLLFGADLDREFSGFLEKVVDLNRHVLDTSTLILDPRLNTYYLMDAFALKVPEMMAELANLRARSMQALGSSSMARRAEVEALSVSFRKELAALRDSIKKVTEYERAAAETAEKRYAALESKSGVFLGLMGRLSVSDAPTTPVFDRPFIEAGFATAKTLGELAGDGAKELSRALDVVADDLQRAQVQAAASVGVVVVLALLLAFMGVRSVTGPVSYLTGVVDKLAQGDTTARARLATRDEIGRLAQQFDVMLDERMVQEQKIRNENEQLNNSVLGLLQAVAQLSRKDLTVKVPVTEDVTGPVADALNLLTGETAKVLQKVSDISAEVTEASLKVKTQSDTVQNAAEDERQQVEHTAASLESASQTMAKIAEMAQQCNTAAERAIKNTEEALATVTTTVGGINSTRDTIRETEKRIKRLGERSQEISVAVNLINSIAERTHILALNASMHAASAGEAGRGFAVVADEVQRLAENARQATQQIATLVNNIQMETADTVNTMNTAISQVVEGSKLAEQAGRQMQVTQSTTAELVASVQHIAQRSQEQSRASQELLVRAGRIKQSTQETSRQLSEQAEQTNALVAYARELLAAVRVFKLSST